MSISLPLLLLLLHSCVSVCRAAVCFNCSATHRSEDRSCGGQFVPFALDGNSSLDRMGNCTREGALCFVRSWRARATHAWIVQRGCYAPRAGDSSDDSLARKSGKLTCVHSRLPEAEYKVCVCQSDWCNGSTRIILPTLPACLLMAAIGFVIGHDIPNLFFRQTRL